MITSEEHIQNIFQIFIKDKAKIVSQYKVIDKQWKRKNQEDIEDLINNVMLKIVDRIKRKGFKYTNENSYNYYIFISLRNEIFQLTKKPDLYSLDNIIEYDPDFELLDDTEDSVSETNKLNNATNLANEIEEYLNENETPINIGLFKYRFKYGYSIQSISKLTGYSISQIFYRTNKMKLKYQEHFKDFAKNYNKIINNDYLK
jgi:DNA-directed RNA polymerase specialized sigma24 family protein